MRRRIPSGDPEKSYNFTRNCAPVSLRGINRYMFNIQKNPMVTVAEAASALGIDARTVREKLSSGDWKGEKRMIGMKDKWFMYRGELDRQIERLQIAKPKDRTSAEGLDNVFEQETETQTIEAQTVEFESPQETVSDVSKAIEEVLTKLTEQFSKQLNAEKEVIFSLKKELEEKDRQLKLLPDFQKQAEDERKAVELKSLEAEALRKQIAALKEKENAAELANKKIEELEHNLAETQRIAQEEIERMQQEKDAREKAILEQLQNLSTTVQELQKPKPGFWQKLFGGQS